MGNCLPNLGMAKANRFSIFKGPPKLGVRSDEVAESLVDTKFERLCRLFRNTGKNG